MIAVDVSVARLRRGRSILEEWPTRYCIKRFVTKVPTAGTQINMGRRGKRRANIGLWLQPDWHLMTEN